MIQLRTAVIDAEIETAIAHGCRQLVILGAGLDTRAFRIGSLAEVAVFEADHPGFEVISNTIPAEWARRFGAKEPPDQRAAASHLLSARRHGLIEPQE